MQSRKSLLYGVSEIWVEKDNPNFDVTMGSFNGAEVCDLVGLYLPNIWKSEFGGKNIGLHRDNGLGCFENGLEFDQKSKRRYAKVLKIIV